MFVVDASITLAWCFTDESSRYADEVLGHLGDGEAMAPAIWPLEVANGLLTAVRRGRLDAAMLPRLSELLGALPVHVEAVLLSDALGRVLDAARTLELTAYDAAYLDLAARRGVPFATLDERLQSACRAADVELMR
ncbi:type II toxin-antitoxin system VapC family toxin [soil metagenome]